MIHTAVTFICGIAAFHFFPFFPVSIIALGLIATLYLFIKMRENRKRLYAVILICAFGFLYSFMRHERFPAITFPDRDILVEGTVIDVPEITEERIRFTLDNVHIRNQPVHGNIRLSASDKLFYPIKKDSSLGFSSRVYKDMPSHGDRIRVLAKLREPFSFRNPGVYSYDFKKDGIVATGSVKRVQIIRHGRGLLSWIHKKRQGIGNIMNRSLSAENASFQRAIIAGLRRGITDEMRDAFNVTGLAHLLSISGTHFALLAFIVFALIKKIITSLPMKLLAKMTMYVTPTQTAVVVTLPVLVLYALISGGSTPAVRSMIMIFIYMLALFLGRKGQWLNSLSIAAMIILLWEPNALFELSFQLSFLAVLSIGYVLEGKSERTSHSPESRGAGIFAAGFQHVMKKTFGAIKTSLLITLAAVLGTAPLVVLWFKQFPLISPVSNLIITPLICFIVLPLGLFSGFIALLLNLPVMPLNGLIDSVTTFSLGLIQVFSDIPYSNLHLHNPSFAVILLYFLSIIFFLKRRSKWRLVPFLLVVFLYWVSPYLSHHGSLRITFLDVGQGDSSAIELPDKKIMLIDGGTYEPDAGRRVVAPYLWSRGIRHIDYLIVSHPHPDHYGGFMYIMDNFKIRGAWSNSRSAPEAEQFFQKIQEKKIPFRVLRRGDLLETKEYTIYVFHPHEAFLRGESSHTNNNSLVVKIDTGSVSALFTGDIEAGAEADLLTLGSWLNSDIMKVPHHGGKASSSEELLKAVSPDVAVISVGKHNVYNLPGEETIERYRDARIRLFRTDTDGAVTVIARDKSYEVKTYQDSTFREVRELKDEIRNLRLLL